MFLPRKLLFKLMELGLGLRTCFSLDTRDPIFVNFRLSPAEADAVRAALPAGFQLMKLRFFQDDPAPEYWVSYNLYELKYPKKELAAIRKARCEINTFVQDARGRKGVFVFCGSPYVSKEQTPSPMGAVCDAAEKLVIGIYGCGKLIPLVYRPSDASVEIDFQEGASALSLRLPLNGGAGREERLSDDYLAFNDISFFNQGKTHDHVHVNSAFFAARFREVGAGALKDVAAASPFFRRPPDKVYLHRGDIGYLVNALNRDEG
jgi:hypothetical protein